MRPLLTATIITLGFLLPLTRHTCTDPAYYYNQDLGYCILCSFGCLECCD